MTSPTASDDARTVCIASLAWTAEPAPSAASATRLGRGAEGLLRGRGAALRGGDDVLEDVARAVSAWT